jgi:lipopolysaccharide export system permease protein
LKLIHRYILTETLPLFGLCLVAFTFLFIMNKMFSWLDLILNKGVPFWDALMLYLNTIPLFMMMTVPMAMLVAVLLALSRLGSDLEVTALKGSGVHVGHLIVPLLFFGAATTLFMLYFNDRISGLQLLLEEAVFRDRPTESQRRHQRAGLYRRLRGLPVLYRQPDAGRFVARHQDLSQPTATPRLDHRAKSGRITTDPKTFEVNLRLYDGFQSFLTPKQPEVYNRITSDPGAPPRPREQPGPLGRGPKGLQRDELGRIAHRARAMRVSPQGPRFTFALRVPKRLSLPFAAWPSPGSRPLGTPLPSARLHRLHLRHLMVFIYYLVFIISEVSSLNGHIAPSTACG